MFITSHSKFLHKIQAVFIAVFLMLVICRDLVTYTSFKINQDFIAMVLCINKEKPKLDCNGKCHLNKELKKNDSEDRDNKVNFPIVKSEQKINFYSKNVISNNPLFDKTKSQICSNDIMHSYLKVSDIFHPPRICFI
jgi:hypothetical protein